VSILFKITLVCIFGSVLSACGGSSSDDPSVPSVPGDLRVSAVMNTSSAGDQSSASYLYDDIGRLKEIVTVENGSLLSTQSYTYDGRGRVSTILLRRSPDSPFRDNLLEYVYEGNRPLGFFTTAVGFSEPMSGTQFQYSDDGRIISEDLYSVSDITEFSAITDGRLILTNNYIFSGSGAIERIIEDSVAFGIGTQVFETNTIGQRISDTEFDVALGITTNSTWEYQSQNCIESPLGVVLQYVCVQSTR